MTKLPRGMKMKEFSADVLRRLNHKAADLRYTIKRREYEARIFDHKIMQRIYHFIQMKLKAIVNGSYKLYLKCME